MLFYISKEPNSNEDGEVDCSITMMMKADWASSERPQRIYDKQVHLSEHVTPFVSVMPCMEALR